MIRLFIVELIFLILVVVQSLAIGVDGRSLLQQTTENMQQNNIQTATSLPALCQCGVKLTNNRDFNIGCACKLIARDQQLTHKAPVDVDIDVVVIVVAAC